MDGKDNLFDKIKERSEDYLGSKYSQQMYGSSGSGLSSDEQKKQMKEIESTEMSNFEEKQFWRDVDREDFNKPQTMSNETSINV